MKDWETRYNTQKYLFGKRPNRFLVENLNNLPSGKALCLGEGEGRNAVFLAMNGYEVTAVDFSPSALAKTRKLGHEMGATLATVHADLNDYIITPGAWDLILCFFVHLPAEERVRLHRKVVEGLKPGGPYLLEGFAPGQLKYADRGPKNLPQLYDLQKLRGELSELDFRVARETDRLLDDAEPELGMIAVTQILAVKPL